MEAVSGKTSSFSTTTWKEAEQGEIPSSCTRKDVDWILEIISELQEWSGIAIGCSGKWWNHIPESNAEVAFGNVMLWWPWRCCLNGWTQSFPALVFLWVFIKLEKVNVGVANERFNKKLWRDRLSFLIFLPSLLLLLPRWIYAESADNIFTFEFSNKLRLKSVRKLNLSLEHALTACKHMTFNYSCIEYLRPS